MAEKKVLLFITAAVCFFGCSPKTDSEIKSEIENGLKNARDATGLAVDVKGGIATIDGECKDAACVASCEKIAQEVSGVKTVINHVTVGGAPLADNFDTAAAPAPATPVSPPVADEPAATDAEDPLAGRVAEIVKHYPSVSAVVADGVVTVTGNLAAKSVAKLRKALNALKPRNIIFLKAETRKISRHQAQNRKAPAKKVKPRKKGRRR